MLIYKKLIKLRMSITIQQFLGLATFTYLLKIIEILFFSQ
jgi:hypothetical protein